MPCSGGPRATRGPGHRARRRRDRVLMVDHTGAEVDGDELLYVIARSRHRGGMLRGAVVGTLMTNLGLELALQAQGIGLVRTKVGDRYILERLRQEGWTLGGEPSATSSASTAPHRRRHGVRVAGARRDDANGALAARAAGRPEQVPAAPHQRAPGARNADAAMHASPVQEAVREVEAELGAGGRVAGCALPATEPLLRVMVEGEEAGQVERLAGQIADRCGPRSASGVRSLGRDHDDLDAAVCGRGPRRSSCRRSAASCRSRRRTCDCGRHRGSRVLAPPSRGSPTAAVHRAEPVLSVWPSTSMRVLPYWFSVGRRRPARDRTAA